MFEGFRDLIVGVPIKTTICSNGEWRAHKTQEKEGFTGAY